MRGDRRPAPCARCRRDDPKRRARRVRRNRCRAKACAHDRGGNDRFRFKRRRRVQSHGRARRAHFLFLQCMTFMEATMRYQLTPIHCRPWLVAYLSVPLIESHYEYDYGGALRRLNAITEQLQSLDLATTPAHVINGLKREELIALNSTLLHELYFASLGGNGQPTKAMSEILARDFGSLDRWRAEFRAMGYALGGGSGWVLLTYIPRDSRLINQYAAEHSQSVANGVPIPPLDMYEHAYHMDFGANPQ